MKTSIKQLEKLIKEEVEAVIREQTSGPQRIKPMLDGILTAYNAFLVELKKKIKENSGNMGYSMALRYLDPVTGRIKGALDQLATAERNIGKSPEEIRREKEEVRRQTAAAIRAAEEEEARERNR